MVTTLLFSVFVISVNLQPLQQILENPSIEKDVNRDTIPDGWNAYQFDSKGKLSWDKTVAHTGKASLKISDPGRDQSKDWKKSVARWGTQRRPVQPGSSYQLEAWIKTKNLSGQARVILSWQKNGRYLGQKSTATVTGTTNWKKVTLTATAPQQADELVVLFDVGYGNGTAWCDDIKLSGISEPLPDVKFQFNDTSNWFPFVFPQDDINRDSIDLSNFLHKPAGKFGFVSTKSDGHFYFTNEKRARFFGINLGGKGCFPEKKRATILASRFAKYGVNMVRLHSLDSLSAGLIDYSKGNSQNFHPEALDRLDFFIAELKKQGIYIYLDLLDYRMFRTADGVKQGDQFTHNWAGSSKGASIFVERMIELQKDYATKLLTHKNPYTQLKYVDEPAIALVETTNENSVFYFLSNGKLSTEYYRNLLVARWNQWLLKKYHTEAQLQKAWTNKQGASELSSEESLQKSSVLFPKAEISRFSRGAMPDRLKYQMGPLRMRDALLFLMEIQTHYHQQMRKHLKEVVGLKVPISGTNQTFTVADTYINAEQNDFTCGNQYWFHPSMKAKPFPKFANIPRVTSNFAKLRGPMTVLARNTAVGKPMVITEFNYPWPNEYRCEGLLLTTAYTCLQDWDGLLLFSFDPDEKKLSTFRCQSDPVRWGEYPAAAVMFHRHDVAAAKNEIHVVHTPQSRLQLQPDERSAPFTTFRYLTFLSKVRNVFPDGEYKGKAEAVLAAAPSNDAPIPRTVKAIRFDKVPWEQWQYLPFVNQAKKLNLTGYKKMNQLDKKLLSDTGEISLNFNTGLLTINTSHTQSAVGYLNKASGIQLNAVSIQNCKTHFAAITVTSLDNNPIRSSKRMLLTVVARAENTAQGFWPQPINSKSWSPYTTWMLPGEGREPVIAEPVDAQLSLPLSGKSFKVYALDATGKRKKSIDFFTTNNESGFGTAVFNPKQGKSIWYEIVSE